MIDEIADQLERHPKLGAGNNLVVGVSGIDGSGKSTLAAKLERSLTLRGVPTAQVNLDDFLHPKEIRHKNTNQIEGYFEENFDYESLIRGVLDPARATISVRSTLPILELDSDQILERDFRFAGPGILIVEGVFLFRSELREKFDFKIWLEIDFDVAMTRILSRPRDQRYGDVAAIRSRYEDRFFPAQRFHLERDCPSDSADVIVNIS